MTARRSARFPAFLACAALLLSVPAQAQPRQAAEPQGEERVLAAMHRISSHTLFDHVRVMADPAYKGRLTGTPEYDAIADWTASLLARWGIKPAGDQGTWLQKFPNPYTLVLPGAEYTLHVPVGSGTVRRPYVLEEEFFPGSTSDSGTITAEVVYVGYGITAPELNYDDYAGVDVKGKIVLMEPEVPLAPSEQDAARFKAWRPYSFHDYKAKNAAGHGAAGLLYNYHLANPNVVFVKGLGFTAVGRTAVEDLFTGTGKVHPEVVKGIRSSLKPASFPLGKTVTMKNVTEHHAEGIGSNVIGWIEGSDPVLKQEAIVIGAHLDHLGLNPELMPGAHDNASGVAVMLGVAEALATAKIPLRRSVVFIAFGAEEQGVKGSEYYVAHPFVPHTKTVAMLNLESVGRGESIGAGSARNFPQLWDVVDRVNQKYIHRAVRASANANLARPRQDAAHFLWAGVPTISFGSGGAPPLPYATYHTTKDNLDLITPEIMEDLARLVFLATVELAK
ncbi:MAG TPA: M28 family peptidase [Vicinamibacterales bacterium]|nr:M28 family peptidase [Vicinamibacterales bacterium]